MLVIRGLIFERAYIRGGLIFRILRYIKTLMQNKKYSFRQRERSRIGHSNQLFSLNPVLKIRFII